MLINSLIFSKNQATEAEIKKHLLQCNDAFIPHLSERVKIDQYAQKILTKATRFEAWLQGELVGLLAVYCDALDEAFITNLSVLPSFQNRGIAFNLMQDCINHLKERSINKLVLEVATENLGAISFYEKLNFRTQENRACSIIMKLSIEGEVMSNQRDYDAETKDTSDHQYAYSFDFDVIHPYMIQSFEPFFQKGNLLELGSFRGDFTRRLLPYSDEITCVEASSDALGVAKNNLGNSLDYINGNFETVSLNKKYENIIMTHVLEHLDDPVAVLKRVNDEWLSDQGYFFLVCPNANAPSRQIAVKMGLIAHNAAVTPAEDAHGHRCTYSLDTLERDAVAAGLKVVYRTGIFFKAFANFQWDQLLKTDIISKDYLDGCYKLGQHYPELCSSIFLLCKKGSIV